MPTVAGIGVGDGFDHEDVEADHAGDGDGDGAQGVVLAGAGDGGLDGFGVDGHRQRRDRVADALAAEQRVVVEEAGDGDQPADGERGADGGWDAVGVAHGGGPYAVIGLAVRSIVEVPKQAISPELLVSLDRSVGGLRAQLEGALRSAVRDGRLAAGSRLPATRALADELGVSRATVTEAYAQLVAEGYLVGQVGSGTHVAATPRTALRGTTANCGPGTPSPVALRPSSRHPGSPEVPPPGDRAGDACRAFAELPDAELDYGDPRGMPRLRVALAAYLGRVRGVAAGPEEIIVSGGFGHGLVAVPRLGAARAARARVTGAGSDTRVPGVADDPADRRARRQARHRRRRSGRDRCSFRDRDPRAPVPDRGRDGVGAARGAGRVGPRGGAVA